MNSRVEMRVHFYLPLREDDRNRTCKPFSKGYAFLAHFLILYIFGVIDLVLHFSQSFLFNL